MTIKTLITLYLKLKRCGMTCAADEKLRLIKIKMRNQSLIVHENGGNSSACITVSASRATTE